MPTGSFVLFVYLLSPVLVCCVCVGRRVDVRVCETEPSVLLAFLFPVFVLEAFLLGISITEKRLELGSPLLHLMWCAYIIAASKGIRKKKI